MAHILSATINWNVLVQIFDIIATHRLKIDIISRPFRITGRSPEGFYVSDSKHAING
jgi:hypothetical protein